MSCVQPGIAGGGVPSSEVALEDLLGPAETLGDVVTGQLHVHTAGPASCCTVYREERTQFGEDVVESACLAAAFAGERVAVHRVTHPYDRMAGFGDRPDVRWEVLFDLVGSEPGDQREATRGASGIQPVTERHRVLG